MASNGLSWSRWICVPSISLINRLFLRHSFNDLFAFGAPKVIGHFIPIWMISYADRVLITGMKSTTSIPNLLYASDLGRRTSVLFLHREEEKEKEKEKVEKGKGKEKGKETGKETEMEKKKGGTLFIAKYAWEHGNQRPNTHTFPLSCSKCHCIRSWHRPETVQGREDGEPFTLPCTTKSVIRGKQTVCSGSCEIGPRPPSTLVNSPYVGSWFSFDPEKA